MVEGRRDGVNIPLEDVSTIDLRLCRFLENYEKRSSERRVRGHSPRCPERMS